MTKDDLLAVRGLVRHLEAALEEQHDMVSRKHAFQDFDASVLG